MAALKEGSWGIMKKLAVVVLVILGIAFLGAAAYYWMTPADSLPRFVPGYEAGVTAKHFKHGLAALILAVGCGVLAWFLTGGKDESTSPESTPKA
jgi:hypothetical protein